MERSLLTNVKNITRMRVLRLKDHDLNLFGRGMDKEKRHQDGECAFSFQILDGEIPITKLRRRVFRLAKQSQSILIFPLCADLHHTGDRG